MVLEEEDIKRIAETLKELTPAAPGAAAQGIQAVALKLPEFWTDKPEVWFARVEAQFGTKGITQDDTKFNYLVIPIYVLNSQELGKFPESSNNGSRAVLG